jgi:hypothetical protein
MPTSDLMHGVVNRQLTSVSFQTAHTFRPSPVMISSLSWEATGEDITGAAVTQLASGTYPGANRSLGFPFQLADPFLCMKVWWMNGTTVGTDIADVGIYTEAGTKLVSATTPPTVAGANVIQEADCTDTLIPPGRYWCVYAQSGTTATPTMNPLGPAHSRPMGWAQMASGMSGNALVATFVPAAVAGTNVPHHGVAGRTQVA